MNGSAAVEQSFLAMITPIKKCYHFRSSKTKRQDARSALAIVSLMMVIMLALTRMFASHRRRAAHTLSIVIEQH